VQGERSGLRFSNVALASHGVTFVPTSNVQPQSDGSRKKYSILPFTCSRRATASPPAPRAVRHCPRPPHRAPPALPRHASCAAAADLRVVHRASLPQTSASRAASPPAPTRRAPLLQTSASLPRKRNSSLSSVTKGRRACFLSTKRE
jgi:hypothetical protein